MKSTCNCFSEPPVDYVYEEDFTHNDNEHVFGVEFYRDSLTREPIVPYSVSNC